ncbi:hypothetical protein V2J81_06170 [Pseudomonas alliivorans]|nr:hypothetical protein [Pseudomonas alliivorans]
MSRQENITTSAPAQQLLTVEVGFCDTPIDNRGVQIFNVAAGTGAEDVLETARMLSSGLGQLCRNLHDTLNEGGLAYCDGVAAMAFLAETSSALVWSVQRGLRQSEKDASQ